MTPSNASIACPKCGAIVPEGDKDCPSCGAPLILGKHLSGIRRAAGGTGFEYKSPLSIFGWPLVHVAFGRDGSGRFRVARGVIAIGQFGIGLITFAQLGLGVLFGFGQLMGGLVAIGQVAPAVFFGIGQLTTGHVAIGQLAIGDWVLAQIGLGIHVWSTTTADPEAVAYFTGLWETIRTIMQSIF
jgi:ribosomal protein S27AE